MKKFVTPEVEVLGIDVVDVITTSQLDDNMTEKN
jgi:hypothetical protein